MKNKLETVPFQDTAEQHSQLQQVIAEYQDVPGALVQVLKKAQEIYGYLPLEVQITVAEGLDVSLEEVYGVVTFYSSFPHSPREPTRSRSAWGRPVTSRAPATSLIVRASDWGSTTADVPPTGSFCLRPAAASARAALLRS